MKMVINEKMIKSEKISTNTTTNKRQVFFSLKRFLYQTKSICYKVYIKGLIECNSLKKW